MASQLRNSTFSQRLLLLLMAPGLILFPVLPLSVKANPSGAAVAAGVVGFNGLGTSNLTINQSSANAIINWQSFSIGAGEITRFVQPSSSALAINRVVAGNPSAIYGTLAANGNVMVINPNGILVGASGVVNVGGTLTLSTLDATNAELLSGGGINFRGNSGAGVQNFGTISARDAILLGNYIQNAGTITGSRSVVMGAGNDIVLNQTADGATISVRGGAAGNEGITNSGSVTGGNVHLETGGAYSLGINNEGAVRATGYRFSGGKLTLNAGSRNPFVNTGNLYARRGDGGGGQINVTASRADIRSGTVDASGAPGRDGGDINVTATDIDVSDDVVMIADGENGGSVNLIAENILTTSGTISAQGDAVGNGGQVDLSGTLVSVGATSTVDVSGGSGGRIRAGGGRQGVESDIVNSELTNVAAGSVMVADGSDGNGGEVIVWSDGSTLFEGQISAQATGAIGNGGFIEVSGVGGLTYAGVASTRSANGTNGTLLLDPTDVVIGAFGNSGITISDAALVAAVLNNNVVIHTASTGTAAGDIIINSGSDIQYDSPNSLSFFAHRHIFVNGDIKNHGTTDTAFAGTGNITLVAGWDGTGAGNFGFIPDAADEATAIGGVGSDPFITAADVIAGTYGTWGNATGSIFINDAAAEQVEVGSARGETNAFGDLFVMTAGNGGGEFSQFGYRRENDLRGIAISSLGDDGMYGGTGADADVFINTGLDLDFDTGVTGDINIYGNSGVFAIQHLGTNADEGVKNVDRTYVMIGHGGIRENNNDIEFRNTGGLSDLNESSIAVASGLADTRDYSSDSHNMSVGNGDNHGNITINTNGVLQLQAARAEGHAQIGHGGLANDDPDGDRGNTVSDSGLGDNNTRNIHVFGNMTGDITITAGSVDMEGGRYNDAPVIIGHGGTRIRGEHGGNISITTTNGGIRARAAPDSASGGPANSNDWRWRNNRDQSHAQIGHGGFDSDFLFLDSLAGWDGTSTNGGVAPGARGRGAYDTVGDVSRPDDANAPFMDARPRRGSAAAPLILETNDGPTDSVNNSSRPGDGIAVNFVRGRLTDADGPTGESFGHWGDITINSATRVEFVAANGSDAYAMVGHGGRSTHGDHNGNITVNALGGDIVFTREAWQINERGRDITNRGHRAHVQIGHGGTRYNGGATGDINVSAAGDIEFYGGRQEAYAQLGHGGRGEDSSTWNGGRQRNEIANGTHSGDITVVAGGDIIFRSGFTDVQAHSQLGHGGYYQFADVESNGGYAGVELFGGGVDYLFDGPLTLAGGTGTAVELTSPESVTLTANGSSLQALIDAHNGNPANADNQIVVLAGDTSQVPTDDVTLNPIEGHHGDISVTAGGDISFIAGQNEMLLGQQWQEFDGGDNYTMLGHGGRFSKGDHFGDINVNATGDLHFESRGGWDAITIDGTNEDPNQDPFLNNTGDNARTGYRNFALLGHGGHDAEHRNDDFGDGWNNSGKEGDGLGVLGSSNITIDVGGDIIALAAPASSTVVRPMPIRILDGPNTAGNPNNGNVLNDYVTEGEVVYQGAVPGMTTGVVLLAPGVDEPGVAEGVTLTGDGTSTLQELIDAHNALNPENAIQVIYGDLSQVPDNGEAIAFSTTVRPSQFFSDYNGRLAQVTRNDGEVWNLPQPVLSAEDSFVQIGTGGRATDYRGSGGADSTGGSTPINSIDGLGHRGDISITVGGNMRVEASDIKQAVSSGQALQINVNNFQGNVGGVGTVGDTGYYLAGPAVNGQFIGGDNSQDDPSQGTRNYAMIGLGGDTARGDHYGAISINGDGDNSNGGDLLLIAGAGRQAFAQIGNGGYDSDRQNSDNSRDGDTGATSFININIDGFLDMQGGGLQNGDTTGVVAELLGGIGVDTRVDNDITRGSYVQIGSGGLSNGGSHHADITIETGTGVNLEGGSSTRGAYGIIGSGGTWGRSENLTGDISVVARSGDINLYGGTPKIDDGSDDFLANDPATAFNEALYRYSNPDNTGNVATARETYVMIGNGGFDTDAQGGNQNNAAGDGSGYSGEITVIAATGNVVIQGGGNLILNRDDRPGTGTGDDNFRGFYAKIGHGGPYSDGDSTGDITLTAGGSLSVVGGFGSRRAAAHVGHGGNDTSGNLSGDIVVTVGSNLIMQRGTRVDAHGNTVRDAFAKIGHAATIFNGGSGNGSGSRTGDVLVSVGNTIVAANGYNLQRITDDDVEAAAVAGAGTVTLTGIDEAGEAIIPNSVGIVVRINTDGDGNPNSFVHYGDDGNGNIVLIGTQANSDDDGNFTEDVIVRAATQTVVGTINYATGEITFTSSLNEADLESVLADYATTGALEDTGFGAQIGHVDPYNTGVGFTIGADGETWIAAGRSAPTGLDDLGNPLPAALWTFTDGSSQLLEFGTIYMDDGTILSSTDGGLTTELRLYTPSAASNQIQTGVYVNNTNFDRVDFGGVGARDGIDEHVATDHTQGTGVYGEPTQAFVPEGNYPFHPLGNYDVYYASTDPLDPGTGPTTPTAGPRPPAPPAPFPFAGFFFQDFNPELEWAEADLDETDENGDTGEGTGEGEEDEEDELRERDAAYYFRGGYGVFYISVNPNYYSSGRILGGEQYFPTGF